MCFWILNGEIFGGSGFKHTAFSFDDEAEIENIPIDKSKIDKDALSSFVHKGLQYSQLEANLHAVGAFGSLDLLSLTFV